jgi:glycosyltransferase involved in cell wall biosynthesis
MRIALFLEDNPETGGGFQQALSTVKCLMRQNATRHEFTVFTPFEQTRQLLLEEGIEAIWYRSSVVRLIDRWSATMLGNTVLRRLRRLGLRHMGRHLDALLDHHGVDLVFLTAIGEAAVRIGDHPFIVTIHDLSHHGNPEFPEAYANRVFERRERILQSALMRAMAVVADSAFGARQIASYYHVNAKRIIELPFLPALAVQRHAAGKGTVTVDGVRRKYNLPLRYIFYPAYYSYHKNHLYLLEGLLDLERRHGITLHAVFCGGGDPGDQEAVERQVQALGLMARIRFLGLIPDKEVPALYEGALALVMPSYFGPTNLPPLEAITLGCLVIYADLPEFREQMGDAALYCDLNNVSSLADHLAALIQDTTLLDRLRKAGLRRAAEIATIDYGKLLAPVFDNYDYIHRRWAWPESSL